MLSLSCLELQRSPRSNNALGGEGGGERGRETVIHKEGERVKRMGASTSCLLLIAGPARCPPVPLTQQDSGS